MAALVAGGGADALDDRDRAAVERLIRVKIPHETPRIPSSTLSGWWMAVPGASYEGVFEALGLHDRRPVTVAAGVQAAESQETRIPGPNGAARTVGRGEVGPDTEVRGHGWLALTAPAVGHGAFPGTLRI
ncbi:hypothetical protein [Streptomyces durhamensis]|uniref:hypothetical protein n=1 Tax=Streptomyces durhamensis TaxID=68194 RepID=UPI0004CCE090|nr:hypothetical protein [Streptomyces durhamensis]